MFASDEEALAAAEEAYGKYLETVTTVLADGGRSPDRLLEYVSAELFARDLPGYQTFAKNHWRATGHISFTMQPQQVDSILGDLVVYTCEDRTYFDVVDENDLSVLPDRQMARSAFEVSLDWTGASLVIIDQESWTGGGICRD